MMMMNDNFMKNLNDDEFCIQMIECFFLIKEPPKFKKCWIIFANNSDMALTYFLVEIL